MELFTTMNTHQFLRNPLRFGKAVAPLRLGPLFCQSDGGLEIRVVLFDKRVVCLQVGHHTGDNIALSALCASLNGQGLLYISGSTIELHGAGTGSSMDVPHLFVRPGHLFVRGVRCTDLALSGAGGSSARLLAMCGSTGGPNRLGCSRFHGWRAL